MTVRITVRCVACKATREVGAEQSDIPLCDRCFSPMVAVSAVGKTS